MSRAWIVVLLMFSLPLVASIRTVQARVDIATWTGNSYARYGAADRPRGLIVSADGVVLAESDRSGSKGGLRYVRRYPEGGRTAGVVGYRSVDYGGRGLDDYLWPELVGRPSRSIQLTLDSRIQNAAEEALGDREGAVVVLEVPTGRILALSTSPTFEPGPLGSASLAEQKSAAVRLSDAADPSRPLLNRAISDTYATGSTMKLVVLAGALDAGIVDEETEFPAEVEYSGIRNSADRKCGGPLETALRESCNTSFIRIGEQLGPELFVSTATALGFGAPLILGPVVGDRPLEAVPSSVGEVDESSIRTASIGQGEVRATPLQMAVVAATIADDGRRPKPYLWGEGQDPSMNQQVIRPESASIIRDFMARDEDESGAVGSAAFVEGVVTGRKTGTAEFQVVGSDHAWMVGFAGRSGSAPEIAFAVFVHANNGSGQSGDGTAGPIAQAVVRAAMDVR